jgi:aminoglycoside phosphotransferase (APT) family kinase protein
LDTVKKHSGIAVPIVFEWGDDRSNEIGSEYIIMEYAHGVSLQEKWPDVELDQRIQYVGNVFHVLSSIENSRLPAYRSLYTTDHPPDSAIISTKDN